MLPIYRFMRFEDPLLKVSEPYELTFTDGSRIKYMKAIYHLRCDPLRNNNVHEYLATDPYGGTTNIVGFLKFEQEPLGRHRAHVLNPQDYFVWSSMFRIRTPTERLNRVPFITSYEKQGAQILVGGQAVFHNIDCPLSGAGTDDRYVRSRFEEEYIRGKPATCDHEDYPVAGCPPASVVANLGSLMPNPNNKEVNFIGNADIKGLLVLAVAPVKGDYQYLSSRRPIANEELVSDFLDFLGKNPVYLQGVLQSIDEGTLYGTE